MIPPAANDFPLLINSSPLAGAATAATGTTASTTAPTINCGSGGTAGGRILVTGGGGHGRSGGSASGHASRESSTGPIRSGITNVSYLLLQLL